MQFKQLEELKQKLTGQTIVDDRGVRRMATNDAGTPSPSRLMQTINLFHKTSIPSHMIVRSIKVALETQNDNYELLKQWGVAD